MPAATRTPPPAGTPPSTASTVPRPLALRWTVEQFHQMGSMGWFEGRRPFLLDGVIWEQGPMNPPHASAVYVLSKLLESIFGAGWVVRPQLPLTLDAQNDPLPDVAVCTGAPEDYFDVHPTSASLVVEISDTTLQLDLTKKAERYATAGVPEYWVLDLEGQRLFVLRDPQVLPEGLGGTAYRDQKTLATLDHVTPLAAPASSLPVSKMFPKRPAPGC